MFRYLIIIFFATKLFKPLTLNKMNCNRDAFSLFPKALMNSLAQYWVCGS